MLIGAIYTAASPKLAASTQLSSTCNFDEASEAPARKLWETEAKAIFQSVDKDSKGVISFDEFVSAATTTPVLVLGTSLLSTAAEQQFAQTMREVGPVKVIFEGTVIGHHAANRCCDRYTVFQLRIEDQHGKPFRREKRYSDFIALHKRMQAHLCQKRGARTITLNLLSPPPKTPPWKKFLPSVIEERRRGLQQYVDQLHRLPDAVVQSEFREFLGLPFRRYD